MALGLRFAGSANSDAFDCLYEFARTFMKIMSFAGTAAVVSICITLCVCVFKFVLSSDISKAFQRLPQSWEVLCFLTYFTLDCDFLYLLSICLSSWRHVRWFLQQTGYYNLQTGLSMILLAMSMVMSGTGNLKVLQLCRFFHKRTGGEMNYGFHMAHHMALGLLFLGGGRWDAKHRHRHPQKTGNTRQRFFFFPTAAI